MLLEEKMDSYIYVNKSEIVDKTLKEMLEKTILREKKSLENDIKLEFEKKYLKVSYKNEILYWNTGTFHFFPLFDKKNFLEYNLDISFDKLKDDLIRYFPLGNEMEIMTPYDYRINFFQENIQGLIHDGMLLDIEGKEIKYFLVKNEEELLEIIDNKNEKVNKQGRFIPILKFQDIPIRKDFIEEKLLFLKKYTIKILFENSILEKKYERLQEIYELLARYNIQGENFSSMNRNTILEDLENGYYIYPVEQYIEHLRIIEKERINTDEYHSSIFENPQEGHWDLYYPDIKEEIEKKEKIKIKTEFLYIKRNPEKDIREAGVIAIDFGTRSTVVAKQLDNDRSSLVSVGGDSYIKEKNSSQYENPTFMHFIDVVSFLEAYQKNSGRPFTKWEDLKVSHTAVSNFIGGSSSVINNLKQWCGNKEEKMIFSDENGRKYFMPPYLELTEQDMDIIEIYAYYIGSYINNMHTKNIFLTYLLSFPVTYEQEIRNKMKESFTRGLKKSLPVSILKDETLMKKFRVLNSVSEPTAYFLSAVKEYGIPIGKEKLFYGVFDVGGGTIDFSFGSYFESDKPRYDYELHYFGEGGDRNLGGENILQALSYEIFQKNQELLKQKKVVFSKPSFCDSFDGYEILIQDSYEANFNMMKLCEKLRNFWENPSSIEEDEEYQTGKITLPIYTSDRKQEIITLDIEIEKLKKIIKDKIRVGAKNFIGSLSMIFQGNSPIKEVQKIHIFLAGNGGSNPYVQDVFKKEIKKLKQEIIEEENMEESSEIFPIYPPLGTKEAKEIQKRNQMNDESKNMIMNGKTGTAYGLLETRPGGRIKIQAIDEEKNQSEINFKYYVGYAKKGKLKVVLDYKDSYHCWKELMDAGEENTTFYYSSMASTLDCDISTTDSTVKRKDIILISPNPEASIFLRSVATDRIEYVVAYPDEIKEEKYLEGPIPIKL